MELIFWGAYASCGLAFACFSAGLVAGKRTLVLSDLFPFTCFWVGWPVILIAALLHKASDPEQT